MGELQGELQSLENSVDNSSSTEQIFTGGFFLHRTMLFGPFRNNTANRWSGKMTRFPVVIGLFFVEIRFVL